MANRLRVELFCPYFPAAINVVLGQMKQQRVKFAVETTPPECLFDHSTIFDYSFIFPAAVSLSVVLLSFELLYQHYIATINDICGPNKAMER